MGHGCRLSGERSVDVSHEVEKEVFLREDHSKQKKELCEWDGVLVLETDMQKKIRGPGNWLF